MKVLHTEEAEADERPGSLYYELFWSEDAVPKAQPSLRARRSTRTGPDRCEASSASYGFFTASCVAPRTGRRMVFRDAEHVGLAAPLVNVLCLRLLRDASQWRVDHENSFELQPRCSAFQ